MFRIVNRLIQWTGKYKRRIYIGFVYAFIHSIFTAIPIMFDRLATLCYNQGDTSLRFRLPA